MKTSVIRYRVADFLKQYPPFNELSEEELLSLAASGRVVFHESDEYIFRKNQKKAASIWVIQQGSVQIIDETAEGDQLRDLLGEGDLLGTEAGATYESSARTTGDVLLYTIDGEQFWQIAAMNPRVGRYLAAIHDSANVASGATETAEVKAIGRTTWLDLPGPALDQLSRHLVVAHPGETVGAAALRMAQANSDWIAVELEKPLGLITTRNLRDHIANGNSSGAQIESLITSPPETAAAGLTAGDYFLLMMRHRSRAIAITADGSAQSRLQGVVTDADLSLSTGHNPALLVEQALQSISGSDWGRLLLQSGNLVASALAGPANVDRCAQMTSEFQSAMLEAIIGRVARELAAEGFSMPAVPHCWLLFGRAGRAEAVAPMHPEIGLVFDAAAAGGDSPEYFSLLLKRVISCLEASGLQSPPDLVLGEVVSPCQSLSAWKKLFQDLIDDPIGNSVYRTRTLFDFQPVHGDRRLFEELRQTIVSALRQGEAFMMIMANDTMSNLPPLTFFHGLVVELDGAQHDTLNIETTALGPISDAARVFALASGNLDVANTRSRLKQAALATPAHAAVLQDAAQAFQVAAYQQAIAAFAGEGKGAVIRPTVLGRYEQRLLKTSFDAVRRLLEVASTVFDTAA